MSKVLLQDIVIPKGTVFDTAPRITKRIEDHYCVVIGLTKDTAGDLVYYIDPDDLGMKKWFMDIEEYNKGETNGGWLHTPWHV